MSNKNSGFTTPNGDAAHLAHQTVLVLGVGRGGTSMVAGVLSKLGVYMGEGLSSRYQDNLLLDCLHRNDKKQAQQIIHDRNALYPLWGMKKLRYLWRWRHLFREPVYVVVFRDVFATANRRAGIYNNTTLVSEMLKVLGLNFWLLIFLKFNKRPVFIASYEKALLSPEGFTTGLAQFLGLGQAQDWPSQFAEAVRFINPSPPTYTNTLVNFKAIAANQSHAGYIDRLEPSQIVGWALSKAHQEPVSVDLFINGQYKQTASAHLSRQDVSGQGYHEHCGFVFRLAARELLNKGDVVAVRITGEDISLNNSPQEFV